MEPPNSLGGQYTYDKDDQSDGCDSLNDPPCRRVGGVDSDEDKQSEIRQLDGCDSVSEGNDSSDDDTESVYSFNTFSSYSSDSYSDYSSDSYSNDSCWDETEERVIQVIANLKFSVAPPVAPPVWYEKYEPRPTNLPIVRQTLKRNNKFEKCGLLPTLSVPNVRSFFPKAHSFVQDMRMRSISLAIISETWERETKKSHMKEVERLL